VAKSVNPNNNPNNRGPIKKLTRNLLIFLGAFVVVSGLVLLYSVPLEEKEEVSLSKLASQINNEQVSQINVQGNELEIELKDGTQEISRKEPESSLTESLANVGVEKDKLRDIQLNLEDTSGRDFWLAFFVPFILPFIFIAFFIWFLLRQAQRGNNQAMTFGRSRARVLLPARDKEGRITFKDVAGAKEAKEELHEVVEFLRTPKKFWNLGARIPRGFLLLGPPGTGKTLLAKAVAGEANVPFFSISGSEFVEMFVGVGASRVRDLFKQAKKNSPAIVFIDEIDAVGRHRGAGLGGGNDEREQTLNQILVEMDGFDTNVNVIVIAATNRPDVLDPALLRPGRFDRRVTIDNPDIEEREAILKLHVTDKKMEKDVSLRQVAERTPGFSGADLANLVNEAAILAARRNKKTTGMDELREAIEKVILGPERRSKVFSPEEKKVTAYHEGGHALVSASLPNADPVHKVSIVSRGHAAGYTLNVPEKDRSLKFRSYFLDQLTVLLGGYAAEERIFDEMTTGASNDLERATEMARKLVTRFGMSKLGPVTYGENEDMVFLGRDIQDKKNYSEKVAESIDEEVRRFIEEAHQKAREILREKSETLEKIAQALIKKETLEKDEFDALVGD
jgi:cell division protease FtsH